MTPAQVLSFYATGLCYAGGITANAYCNPAGPTTGGRRGFVGDEAAYGYIAADGASSASVEAAGRYSMVIALKDDGAGPPDVFPRGTPPSPIHDGYCPGNATAFPITNGSGVNKRVWAIFNCEGNFYSDISEGPFSLTISVPIPDSIGTPAPMACQECCANRNKVTWVTVYAIDSGGTQTHPAQRYDLYRQVNGAGGYFFLRSYYANDSFVYLDANVSEGSTYQYKVIAIYNALTSDPGIVSITDDGWNGFTVPDCDYVGFTIPASAWSGRDCGC